MKLVNKLRNLFKPYIIVFRHVIDKPYTLKYPYERLEFSDRYRGRIRFHIDKCTSCRLCSRVCPTKAIEMVMLNETGKVHPKIDFGLCCFCGLCVDVCPRKALETTPLVELSTEHRESLIYPPKKLAEEVKIEEVLKDVKRIISTEIRGSKVVYVVKRRVK